MANRVAALGIVALCVLALGLTAAGLPTLSPEPVADGGEVESDNATLGSSGGGPDWDDNETYRMSGNPGNGSQNDSGFVALIPGASDMLPGALSPDESADTGGESRSSRTSLLGVSSTVLGVVTLALAAAVLTLRSVSGSADETDDDSESEGVSQRSPEAVAAAGRGADAVADAGGDPSELSNAVYRTWYEMTAALDVSNPDTATPGEFATAARSAGLDADAVDDLTTVFEAVRYGDEPVADHEDRALAALRRIERDGEPAGSDGADGR
jgi:hypothetical protein